MRSGDTSSTRKQQTLNFTFAPIGASTVDLSLGLYYTGNISVTWNPGIISNLYSSSANSQRLFTNTYVSTGATGTIRGNVNLIRRITASTTGTIPLTVLASETSKLHSLAEFSSGATQSWQFNMSALPSMMTTMGNGGLNTSFGSIGSSSSTNLPAGLTYFSVGGLNTMTGDITHLPTGLTTFAVSNAQGYPSTLNLTGSINYLPPNLTTFSITGSLSTISGDIWNLVYLASLTNFTLLGANSVDGDIIGLPSSLITFNVRGNNYITGDIANIPASISYFYIAGNNTLVGDISNLKSALTTFYITSGTNTITGTMASLALACPSISTFSVYGRNQITGNIADFPATISNFNMYGYNIISGAIADIKPAMRTFYYRSFGTITGNLNTIPSALTTFSVSALTGNIYPGPSAGTCTIFGNIADIPNSVSYFYLSNCTGALTYTGKVWPTMDYFAISPKSGYGLTQSQVNALLIDLAAATWSGGYKVLSLAGFNAAPDYGNPAVTVAIATLQTKVTLTINP